MYIITVGERVNESCNTARHVWKVARDEQVSDKNVDHRKKKIRLFVSWISSIDLDSVVPIEAKS